MSEPDLIGWQRQCLDEVRAEVRRRVTEEPVLERTYREAREAAEEEFQAAEKQVLAQAEARTQALDAELATTREALEARFQAEQAEAVKQRNAHRARIRFRYKIAREAARGVDQDARWSIAAVLEGTRTEAQQQLQQDQAGVKERLAALDALNTQTRTLLAAWKQPLDEFDVLPLQAGQLRKYKELFDEANQLHDEMDQLRSPRWLHRGRLTALCLLAAVGLTWPLGRLAAGALVPEPALPLILGIGGPLALLLSTLAGWIGYGVIRSMAQRRVQALYLPFRQALADSEVWRDARLEQAQFKARQQINEANKTHNDRVLAVREKYDAQKVALRDNRKTALARVEKRLKRTLVEARDRRDKDAQAAVDKHAQTNVQLTAQRDAVLHQLQKRREQRLAENEAYYQEGRKALLARWRRAVDPAAAAVADDRQRCEQWFPPWDSPVWHDWSPPQSMPPVLRFGEYRVDLGRLWDEAAQGDWSRQGPLPDWHVPALTPFPDRSSFLFLTEEGGRTLALDAVRALMMRMLTSVPPGKLRFTIIDPVGLGQNFATFMNLADHDEALVGARIWTEQAHVEQRLSDLTAHMENVIQKYLRNRYENITEYNRQADELAEPYRVLVVANFPVNFSLEASRRLVSICQSGARCGVSVLITVDRRQELPQGFDLADLKVAGATLICDDTGLRWQDADLGGYPLRLDPPPDDAFAAGVLQRIGVEAKAAAQVQVPFDFIMPPAGRWWSQDSRDGLTVPLGRSGATKRQLFALGQGTSQHVLVAGKTGSGKSTLLHALIVNLALHYSPHEVELYLVDFKKGVEFKTYAVHQLPHARVVAIESEREFGLSVLQRLDAELKQRGELFREAGAQNLRAYRDATGKNCPRILLIVDEFQEFFVEDDRVSQDAAQLLDRLVRQGRAFGLHIMLGSQTLGGAYSLARSTIDQMAVRIALQCSEADAALILSDENAAARLLSRPGEAIYNDANGRVEGNNPFQVVWLDDDRREALLRELATRADAAQPHRPAPLVFEGHALADLARNRRLGQWLREPPWRSGTAPRSPAAWLGEAIAIKEPTAAVFARQSGTNLLIVGAQEEAARGMLAAALVGLATQTAPETANLTPAARFYVLDGTPADSPGAGTLAQVAAALPHARRCGTWRDVPAFLAELAAELAERQQAADHEAAPVYLLLFGLQRLRDLRRAEDDFGFGKSDEPPSPSKQFATLLTEGPGLGLHVLAWCDSLSNVQRALDRQGLRECTMRVAFQMNVNDASALIDSPLASKLGPRRAIYADEEGRLEKFRPYDLPSPEWLQGLAQPADAPV